MDIKVAFHRLSQTYHPDLTNGKTTEKYQKIANAYSILSHEATRKAYDEERAIVQEEYEREMREK